ncbi:MAG: phosphatidate cytidylyltransferase [Ruminococcaceae bacterium]|nr:phosphatidate cytidylyltransferase [Oscillospiraceae bacterium]
MLKRIITSLVALCILIPVLIFADTPALTVGLAVVACLAVWEVFHCVGLHKNIAISLPFYLCAAAATFATRHLDKVLFFKLAVGVFLGLLLYIFAAMVLGHKKAKMTEMFAAYMMFIYAIAGCCSIVYLHDVQEGGEYVFLLIFLGAWVTDIFAYFTGFFLGKHKLIPEVSPKKTVEGSIGGIFFCAVSFVVFGLVYNHWFAPEGAAVSLIALAIIGVVTSVVAQIGDLALSVVKRYYGIKDYGWIFPGHGGVLDRFDSLFAVAICLAMAFAFV